MGSIRALSDESKNVHLLLTSSNLAEIYVYDILKGRCNATLESIYEVNTLKDMKVILELVNIQPNLADKWLFILNYNKLKGALKKWIGMFQSSTAIFLIKVKTYKEFKEVKDLGVMLNDLYLDSMRRDDIMDLLRGYKISPKVKEFVVSSYSKDPEKVFTLRNELNNGAVVETSKDIIKLCGESVGSIQKLVMQLLLDDPNTERFLQRSYKKRVGAIYDLCDTFGARTAFNYIRAAIKDVLYIKMLYLNGALYDRIYDLPECFDEKKLVKYNYYLKDIAQEVPYSRVLYLYNTLGVYGRWNNVQDGVLFLYKYYLEILDQKKEEV